MEAISRTAVVSDTPVVGCTLGKPKTARAGRDSLGPWSHSDAA
jgi:hypothetical protein